MKTARPQRAAIPPVPPDTPRPLWSVMIPTYNSARDLRETLESVLSQDPGPEQMQIEVVDDCSSDEPERVVGELGSGRVGFFRQPRNVGHIRNFNTCIERSRGHLVHLLHGDDTVRPGFYATMAAPFARHPEIGAAFCRHVYVDVDGREVAVARLHQQEPGIFPDAAYRLTSEVGIQPPAVVVRRATYERLGGFDERLGLALEDLEMWVRIAASYPVWYETEPLALYHQRPGSIVAASAPTGAVLRDFRATIPYVLEHVDEERRRSAAKAATRRCAQWALVQARQLAEQGEIRGSLAQLREAALSDPSPRVAIAVAKALARLAIRRRRQGVSSG